VLLLITELSTLSYRTIGQGACSTRVDPAVCSTTGGEAHSYVLWAIAVFILVFAVGSAAGRSTAAALALVACGGAVLAIAIALDLPDLDGTRGLETLYTDVQAHTGTAFTLELIAGVLAVAAGLAGLTRFRPRTADRGPRGGEQLSAEERAAERQRRRESSRA